MEKELWLDQQEIEQLLSGNLFWQDVQNRADIKIVHKPKEENSSAGDKQEQKRAFLMEQTFSNMTVSENKTRAESSGDVSKDVLEDEGMGAIQEAAASVSEVEKQASASTEATETMATEEFSEEAILEEIIEEVKLEEEITEKEIVAQKETYREERIIFAASKEKKEYFKDTPVREASEAKHTDLHNTMSISWDSEELQVENDSENGSQIEKMERSLEKTFGNGNEFKKLILERELEGGFEDRPIGGIKMFILLGVFAAVTIGVWVFFLSK